MATELEIGYQQIINTISNKVFHPNYKRTTTLALLYKQLITGEGLEHLLKRFVRREDAQLFDQRVNLTQQITPSVASSITNPFYKVGRVNTISKKITIGEKGEVPSPAVLSAIAEYNGKKSVDEYLETRFVDLSFTDPNAWILTEFDTPELGAMGEMTAVVKPRPFEVSSEQAVNFFIDNGITQWLVVRLGASYMVAQETVKAHSYTIYLPNVSIKFTPIDPTRFGGVEDGEKVQTRFIDGSDASIFRANKDELYTIEEFTHNAGQVQGFRVGYKRDLTTDGCTFVNPMHDAMPYFLKTIKTVSEFDLTMALHAFPQKFQYVQRCIAEGCDGGRTVEGGECGTCKGVGYAIHTTAQDAVLLKLPKNKEDMYDLQTLVHYERPPVDILEFQNKIIIALKNDARLAVFNSEIFTKSEVSATATEVKINMEAVYDALFPFAQQFSQAYVNIVGTTIKFVTDQTSDVTHKFPKDFKFKTVNDLLLEQKAASDSQSPSYIRQEISMDIAEQLFIDKPDELKRVKAKQRFFPFPDKTSAEVIYIISNDLTTKYNKILWANFDDIYFWLESDATALGLNFYDYPQSKQQELITAKVNNMIAEMAGVTEDGEPINFNETEPASSADNLRGSVGGLTGMIEIAKAVASGLYDLEAAIALVSDRFGISPEQARIQLGTPLNPIVKEGTVATL